MEFGLASRSVRRLWSAVIVFHLTMVLVGWLSCKSAPLRGFGQSYLSWYQSPFWLDVDPYTNWEITGEPQAFIDLSFDSGGKVQKLRLPSGVRKAGESHHRLRRLAYQACLQSEEGNPHFSAATLQAIAAHYMNAAGAEKGRVACIIHNDRPLDEMLALQPGEEVNHMDPYFFRTVYEANATLFDGAISLIKVEANRSRVSPMAKPNPEQPGSESPSGAPSRSTP